MDVVGAVVGAVVVAVVVAAGARVVVVCGLLAFVGRIVIVDVVVTGVVGTRSKYTLRKLGASNSFHGLQNK